jgi:hypothetical protein
MRSSENGQSEQYYQTMEVLGTTVVYQLWHKLLAQS